MEQFVVLIVAWIILALIGQRRKARREAGRHPPPNSPPEAARRSQLEELMRELERAMDPAARGPLGRSAPRPLPSAEDVEERASLERDERVESLEVDVSRPRRVVVAHDEEAVALAERRAALVEEHNRRLTAADHRAFDQRIRQAQADATRTAAAARLGARAASIRDHVIWREILGPPLALRDDGR
ncbi:MAG: hypothetical protein ACOY71_08660 [Gemmatimonadota bacterium]